MERIRLRYRCSLDWDDLDGDARVRRCRECDTPVINLSALTRPEAERAVARAAAERGEVCVRFVRLDDGRVAYADPPPPARRPARLTVVGAAAAVALAVAMPHAARADSTPPEPPRPAPSGEKQKDPDKTKPPKPRRPTKHGPPHHRRPQDMGLMELDM